MSPAFGRGTFSPDTLELLAALERHGVEFLLIGGHAVFFHGYPRLTADVDLAYRCTLDNARRLYEALAEFWGGEVPYVAGPGELAELGIVIQFGRPPNRIDLLSGPPALDFEVAWGRRLATDLGGLVVPVVALADLRAMKRAAGRPKDLDDLANLPTE